MTIISHLHKLSNSPVVVFLEIFQDGGLYPSFASTAVISSTSDHRDSLATFPGLTTLRIWEISKYFTPAPLSFTAGYSQTYVKRPSVKRSPSI